MAEKLLNTRIALKYDSYENWMKSSLVLKTGEVALCSIPTGTNANGVVLPPAVVAKVGDGVHTFAELSWLQAVASDVYAWAKAAEKPSYSANEITGLSDFISGEIEDTDTQYSIVKGDDDYTYKLMSRAKGATNFTTEVATISIPNPTADINALKTLVGETSVASQIASAIAALKLDETYEKKGAADTVKTALLGDAAEAYNTLGKLEDAVIAAQNAADSCVTNEYFNNALNNYATLTYVGQVQEGLLGADTDTSSYNTVHGSKAYAKELYDNVDERIKDLRKDVGDDSVIYQINAELDKLDVAEVKTGVGEIIATVSQTDGKISAFTRSLVKADIPTIDQAQVDGLAGALAGKQDVLAFESDNYDAETNKVITKSDLNAAVAGLSGAVHFIGVKDALPESANNGDIVIVGNKEYVYATADSKFHELGDETIYAVKGEIVDADIKAGAAIAQSKIAGLTDALGAKANSADLGTMASEAAADYVKKTEAAGYDDILTKTVAGTTYETKTDASNKLTAAKTFTTDEIAKLTLTEVAAGEGSIISAISQENGIVSASTRKLVAADIPALAMTKITGLEDALALKANDADLAAIAKSGSTDDLVQGTMTLVFNCGSASTVI